MGKRFKVSLMDYLKNYGKELIKNILQKAVILHRFGDPVTALPLQRNLFEAQADVVEGMGKYLENERCALINGQMSVGKTIMGIAVSVYLHMASKRETTNVVVCAPPTLLEKWGREITATLGEKVKVFFCNDRNAMTTLRQMESGEHKGLCFWLMSYSNIRMHHHTQKHIVDGFATRGAVRAELGKRGLELHSADNINKGDDVLARCPKCGGYLKEEKKNKTFRYLTVEDLQKKQTTIICDNPRFKGQDTKVYCMSPGETGPIRHRTDWRSTPPMDGKPRLCGHIFKTNVLIKPLDEEEIFDESENPETEPLEIAPGELETVRIFRGAGIGTEIVYEGKKHALAHAVSPAYMALKRYKKAGLIHLGLFDEVHSAKNDGVQGQMTRKLMSACSKLLLLTGTLTGGYARDLFYLLWTINPAQMRKMGYRFEDVGRFEEVYGAKEVKVIERNDGKVVKKPRKMPGVSSKVFSDFLTDRTAFLNMPDLNKVLPPLIEELELVDLDPAMEAAYNKLVADFKAEMAKAFRSEFGQVGGVVSAAVHVWNSWLDRLRADKITGNWQKMVQGKVVEKRPVEIDAPELAIETTPKEDFIIRRCLAEKAAGNKVCIYGTYTDKRDFALRLAGVLEKAGLRVAVLRSKIPAAKREQWIKDNAPDIDILITNPELVKEGYDLIEFSVCIDMQPITNLFTHRQAMARFHRLGQTKPVTLIYIGYRNTIQEKLMALVASKLDSALLAEGNASDSALFEISYSPDSILREMVKAIVSGNDDLITLTTGRRVSTELQLSIDAESFVENGLLSAEDEEADPDSVETEEIVTVEDSGRIRVFHIHVKKMVGKGKAIRASVPVDSLEDIPTGTQFCLFDLDMEEMEAA